jgi:hypothetical protein
MPMIPKVAAPALAAPPHGLVESANIVTQEGGEWESGVQFSPRGCYEVNATGIACPPDDLSELQDCTPWVQFHAFNLELGVEWSTADSLDPEADLRAALEIGTSSALEELVWFGHADVDTPNLSDFPVIGSGTALQALGAAEARLRGNDNGLGSTGTIHMDATTATVLFDHFVEVNGILRTKVGGNVVIIGNYPSEIIAAHAGIVDVYLGAVEMTEALEELRRYNNQVVRAQRPALVAWDTCNTFAIAVTGTTITLAEPES